MDHTIHAAIIEEERILVQQVFPVLAQQHTRIMQELEARQDERSDFIATVRLLSLFAHDRFEAVLDLIACGRPWDAEIVVRSGAEATVKVMFISFCPEEERQRRLHDFWEIAASGSARRQKSRAGVCRAFAPREATEGAASDYDIFRGIEWLSERALDSLPDTSRKERQHVAQRWSVPQMIEDIDNYLQNELHLPTAAALLLHGYGASSSLIHADEAGLGLIWERFSRPAQEHAVVHKSHTCRLMTDVLAYTGMIAMGFSHALGLGKGLNAEMRDLTGDLMDRLSKEQEEFRLSQKDFYDGFLPSE